MEEVELSKWNERASPYVTQYYLECKICESQGPIYFEINGRIVYQPSKNGISLK